MKSSYSIVDKVFLVILGARYSSRENIILLASPIPEGTILSKKYMLDNIICDYNLK